MESIYWVISWPCHRSCEHCYEERFRPYRGQELEVALAESEASLAPVIEHLPERMMYRDLADPLPGGGFGEKRGRIFLAGGEVLLEPVRKRVLHPALDLLHAKYEAAGGVNLVVQTTGDLVTDRLVDELLEHHVSFICVSGLDDHHVGLETESARVALRDKLARMFDAHGMRALRKADGELGPWVDPPAYFFFGALPGSWIGELWPRGRAMANELSTARITDNFCARWSGGKDFLMHGYSGAEVAVDPDGNVYPCCMKTKLPLGNLREDRLFDILDRKVGDPVFEAITAGQPERMGLSHGWTVERFLEASRTILPSGREYRNLCVGCDRFHADVLIPLAARRGDPAR